VLYLRWDSGLTMLGAYGTTTMMINLCDLFLPTRWPLLTSAVNSTIHLFLSVCSIRLMSLPTLTWQSSSCPDCEHHHNHRSTSRARHHIGVTGPRIGNAHGHSLEEAHQPFINSGDEDSRESSEYQTSGFSSPRRSAETLATDFYTDLGEVADRFAQRI
jgi:hypothetical protein